MNFNGNAVAGKKEIWEYKTRDGTLRQMILKTDRTVANEINAEEELNKLGNDGWELTGIEEKPGDSMGPVYIFKRRKE
ncbi:MAG: DUF4177 domain-containing protein [Acidobacteria bacterium]|nr:DUF4177 domain-containing protein [Acidobacteriota bacterium]